jgi:uncharacterized protein YqiB (DUF1249 family)
MTGEQFGVAVAIKRRYQINLAAELAECEANYARLLRLLPEWERDHYSFGVGVDLQVQIAVSARSPYTTTLEFSQRAASIPTVAPSLTVRVYHDARLAEVVAFTSRRRVQPRYEYPNPAMYQPDEKSQWNRFLGEWLRHCLRHGFTLDQSPRQYCEG